MRPSHGMVATQPDLQMIVLFEEFPNRDDVKERRKASALTAVLLWQWRAISARRREFLAPMAPAGGGGAAPAAGPLTERWARRVLTLFARHASLLRPLGAAGKLQLIKVQDSVRPAGAP